MRRFLMNAFDNRSAIIAGYNTSSLELARRLKSNPGMRVEVSGFFDDRSSDRLGMETDATAARLLERHVAVREGQPHRRHFHRVADSPRQAGDEPAGRFARHHGIDLLRAGHLRLRPDSSTLRARSTAFPWSPCAKRPSTVIAAWPNGSPTSASASLILLLLLPLLVLIAARGEGCPLPGPSSSSSAATAWTAARSRSTSFAPCG